MRIMNTKELEAYNEARESELKFYSAHYGKELQTIGGDLQYYGRDGIGFDYEEVRLLISILQKIAREMEANICR